MNRDAEIRADLARLCTGLEFGEPVQWEMASMTYTGTTQFDGIPYILILRPRADQTWGGFIQTQRGTHPETPELLCKHFRKFAADELSFAEAYLTRLFFELASAGYI